MVNEHGYPEDQMYCGYDVQIKCRTFESWISGYFREWIFLESSHESTKLDIDK